MSVRHRLPRKKSQPRKYLQRNVPRRWKYRLGPPSLRARQLSPTRDLWLTVRRTLWSREVWLLVAIAFGVARWWGCAALSGLLALLVRLARSAERLPTAGLALDFPVGSPAFIDSVVGTTGTGFMSGNALTLLNNGDEFYPAMLHAIEGAAHSVTIEGYIYWAGSIGQRFAEALAQRARAGVTVKILLDAIGSAAIGDDILQTLERGGCQVAWFNPIHWYTLERTNRRTHRKTLVIDGTIGFTGGAGIADQWLGHAQDTEHWRDLQLRLEGPAVGQLQTGFATNWLKSTGEIVTGPVFFPRHVDAGSVRVQALLGSPASGASALRMLYYLSLSCAIRSIVIANPYFVPEPTAIELLLDARRRQVDVTLLLAGELNDVWLARQNSVRLYGPLLAAGVKIHEYAPTMLHYKAMIVDDCWATIGTCNFDNRSFALNEESNVTFFDPVLLGSLCRILHADLSRATLVTLESWQRRGLKARAIELAASLLQDQV
jgi:cardiolipin synthase